MAEPLSELAGPRRRGKYRTGVRRQQEIVAAAAEVFAEFGYSGGSLRTIADRIGVSAPNLIQHFGSKEGLLEAVLIDWNDRVHDEFAADLSGLAYFNSFRDLMRYHAEHRGQIELFLTMAVEATSVSHPARRFIRTRYMTSVVNTCDRLREAASAGEIQPLSDAAVEQEVRTLFAVMDGLELQWLLDPSVDMVGLFNGYLDAAIQRWTSA